MAQMISRRVVPLLLSSASPCQKLEYGTSYSLCHASWCLPMLFRTSCSTLISMSIPETIPPRSRLRPTGFCSRWELPATPCEQRTKGRLPVNIKLRRRATKQSHQLQVFKCREPRHSKWSRDEAPVLSSANINFLAAPVPRVLSGEDWSNIRQRFSLELI